MGTLTITGFSDEIAADLKVQMDELDKLGISNIEMRNVNGKHLLEHSIEEIRQIKRDLDQRGFKISAIGSPIGKSNITDNFTPELELLKHAVEAAKVLGTKYIRIFSFFIPQGESYEVHRDEVMCRFKEFIKIIKETDIIILNENETGTYADTPEHCMDLYKTINSPQLKAIMDIGNFVKSGVKNNLEAFQYLKEEIIYFHIKDAIPGEPHFIPIGKGVGMAKEIFSALNNEPCNYFLSIEAHLQYLGISGPEQFNIAATALKDLLFQVTGKSY